MATSSKLKANSKEEKLFNRGVELFQSKCVLLDQIIFIMKSAFVPWKLPRFGTGIEIQYYPGISVGSYCTPYTSLIYSKSMSMKTGSFHRSSVSPRWERCPAATQTPHLHEGEKIQESVFPSAHLFLSLVAGADTDINHIEDHDEINIINWNNNSNPRLTVITRTVTGFALV